MSNLKLPSLEYANLLKLASAGESWVKIGYETYVRRDSESSHVVKVRHHSTVIANVSATKVQAFSGGYHSTTTANRLNRIIYPNCGFHIGIKNGALEIRYGHNETMPFKDGQIFYTKG